MLSRTGVVVFVGLAAVVAGLAVAIAVVLNDSPSGEEVARAASDREAGVVAEPNPGAADQALPVEDEAGEPTDSVAEQQSVVASDDSPPSEPETSGEPQVASEPSTEEEGEEPGLVEEEDAQAVEPRVVVSPRVIRQGEVVFVQLLNVEAGLVLLTVNGATTGMVAEAGAWLGFVPIAPLSELGSYRVIVDVFDDAGTYQTTYLDEFLVLNAGLPVEEITLIPGDEALLAPELVAIDVNVRFVEHRAISGPPLWRGVWMRPVVGNDTGIFGAPRSYNGAPPSDWHHGHDIDGERGDPIVAPAAGRAVFVGELPVHGLGVILDHGAGVYSGYWHMSQTTLEPGTLLESGDVLGQIGDSGLAVGPHLHWEVIVHGQDVDPLQWLSAGLHLPAGPAS